MAHVEIGIAGTIAQRDDEIGGTRWYLERVAKLGIFGAGDGAKVGHDRPAAATAGRRGRDGELGGGDCLAGGVRAAVARVDFDGGDADVGGGRGRESVVEAHAAAGNVAVQDLTLFPVTLFPVTDITYVETGEGWLYLAGVKDLHTGELVGHALGARMTAALTGRTLDQAVCAKRPTPGLIHHSDRGSQYCAQDYQGLLRQFEMKASMSRRGNCYDNAPMESFWGTLKNELVHHRRYETREQATREITEYIEIFYNRQRRHSRLGNLSPAAFTQQFYRQQQAA